MTYILFVIYLIALTWLVTKINYFKAAGLPARWLAILFVAKVACGVLYGFLHGHYIVYSDTWGIFKWSLKHYELLLNDPLKFIQTSRADATSGASIKESFSEVFGSDGSFWNNLKSIVLIKMEAILDIFSFGHYYINVILYTFLTFGGYIAFYRGLLLFYPGSRITSLIAAFLIPSCFFWTSGMYKDGIIFMLFGYIVHNMAMPADRNKFSFIKIVCCLAAIFILRNYIVLLLLPCLAAWWLSVQYPSKTTWWFTGIFLSGLVFFFIIPYIFPAVDFPQLLMNRRNEFTALAANSALPAGQLQPDFAGYLAILPEALNYGFLRPYLWGNKGIFYIPFAVELIGFYILLVIYFMKKNKRLPDRQYAFLLFSLFFLASNWLLIGYTTPITGAIIRYKSIFISFAAAHLLYHTFPRLNTLYK